MGSLFGVFEGRGTCPGRPSTSSPVRCATVAALLLLCGSVSVAQAQDSRYDLLGADHVWFRDGPVGGGAFLDVAASKAPGGPLVAMDAQQAIWWTPSPDRRWIRVLDAPTEARGDGGGSTLDEQLDLAEITDLENSDDMTSVLDGMSGFDDLQDELRLQGQGAGRSIATGRVWALPDGRLAAARSDGLYLADPEAVTWSLQMAGEISSLAVVPVSGTLVVGTVSGLRVADSGSWPSTLDGVEIYDLAASDTRLAAATADGFFVSVDGKRWTRRAQERPVFTVHADEQEPGAVWVGTPGALLRTGMVDEPFLAPVGEAPETVFDLAFGGDGQLLAATDTGAWVSYDAGERWVRRSPGLVGEATGVALRADGAWLAGSDGLMRLQPAQSGAQDAVADEWIPFNALIAASAGRVGVRPREGLSGHSQRIARYLLPQVDVRAWWWSINDRRSTVDTGLALVAGRDSGLRVNLTWRPPTAQTSLEAAVFRSGDPQDADLALLGGSGGFSSSGSFQGQQDAFALVTRLVRDRDTVMRELRLSPPGRTLRDEVHLHLRADEIEAMLDAVTDGAVSRYTAGRE